MMRVLILKLQPVKMSGFFLGVVGMLKTQDGSNGKIYLIGGRISMKPFISLGIYFCTMLLMSYYFVEMSFIKAIQFASIITVIHIAMVFIDRFFKRKQRTKL